MSQPFVIASHYTYNSSSFLSQGVTGDGNMLPADVSLLRCDPECGCETKKVNTRGVNALEMVCEHSGGAV